MRWLTYRHDGAERAGILDEDSNVRGFPAGLTMLELLRSPGGLPARAADVMAGPDHVAAVGDVIVCAPLQPPSIRDCLGFLQHMRNCAAPAGLTIDHRYEQIPAFYFANPGSVHGPTDNVAIFPGSRQFAYELEVCAVIGKPGRDIPRDRAPGHIAGYAIFCDWSARDLQVSELPMGCGPAKMQRRRHHARPAAGHARRDRTPPRRERLRAVDDSSGERRADQPGTLGQHRLGLPT